MATRKRRTVREVLDRLMTERNWSQAEVAAAFGVSQSTISRWRKGERFPARRARHLLLAHGVDPRCL